MSGPTKVIVDLSFMNSPDTGKCPACKRPFSLGETAVLAIGGWEGQRFIHENEATFDPDIRCYKQKNRA